ncbi:MULTISPECIES: hypothetical protein [unclassified Streptomyces]|uniref:hypothetical protein n=1 Tax=unclassified Streptomyces TaxID=2593676 RepID=UPI0013F8931D|nr:hypothetical protein [Streptomyces sp. SID2563]MYW11394.1 hypothetical protein [Streptomyces sp. SID2563]
MNRRMSVAVALFIVAAFAVLGFVFSTGFAGQHPTSADSTPGPTATVQPTATPSPSGDLGWG